jgi:WD40 repeat protein
LQGHRGPVVGVAFSPDGRLLASNSSQDHQLRIWRLDLGLTVGGPVWLGVDGAVSLGWTDGGRKVAVAHLLAGMVLLDIDPARMSAAACALSRRNLTTVEWAQYFGAKPYGRTCSIP